MTDQTEILDHSEDSSLASPNVDYMLTTIDNPYDPFDDFAKWYFFDCSKGYNTCAYLARIAIPSEKFSDQENKEIIKEAIDEILHNDFLHIYKMVERKSEPLEELV